MNTAARRRSSRKRWHRSTKDPLLRRTVARTEFQGPCTEVIHVETFFYPRPKGAGLVQNLRIAKSTTLTKRVQRYHDLVRYHSPPILTIVLATVFRSRLWGFRSMWEMLFSRRYISANAICCRNRRAKGSRRPRLDFTKAARSPPLQYSMII